MAFACGRVRKTTEIPQIRERCAEVARKNCGSNTTVREEARDHGGRWQLKGKWIMTAKTYSIHEIANEFDRLFGQMVDDTEIGWGHGTEAGHIGHTHDDAPSIVGWYCHGGHASYPVLSIANEDIQRAGEVLALMETARSLSDIERAFVSAGICFERKV
jgi:hypothetical protein